jgi:hypothetical protein
MVMEQLFGNTFDVKRLMPGRATGVAVISRREVPVDSLRHDCTTLGGCECAPLVDLETGHVVGIQYAGTYALANYAVPSADLALDPIFVARSEALFAPQAQSLPKRIEVALAAMGRERPALPADDWLNKANERWRSSLEPHKDRIDAALKGVGKLVVDPQTRKWTGSAFLVGGRLALTAAYLVEEFIKGSGEHVELKAGTRAVIEFEGKATTIRSVKFIHPFFPLALVELEHAPDGATALDISSKIPAGLAGRDVALLCFGVEDARLSLRPGQALQMGQMPGSSAVPALVHDCASAGGSVGAPILDLGTGYVIGVQTLTLRQEFRGYAQPTWEITRDPHVWGYEINLRPDPRPSWLATWDSPSTMKKIAPQEPIADPDRWTVDKPLEWGRPEVRALERLVLLQVSPKAALRFAENVAFDTSEIDRNQAPAEFFRDLIKLLARAAKLGQFVRMIADDPGYKGIEKELRVYL